MTLKDFKSVFDRRGNFKFYCKTQDPDCGMVKEEVRSLRERGGGGRGSRWSKAGTVWAVYEFLVRVR